MTWYQNKDRTKFSVCNKLITRGAVGSSSDKYRKGIMGLYLTVNTEDYMPTDTVGVSVNGNRPNRVSFDDNLLLTALDKRVSVVKDNTKNTQRSFNVGEREVERFLIANNYYLATEDSARSTWLPK